MGRLPGARLEETTVPTFASYDDVLHDAGYRPNEPSPNVAVIDRATTAGGECAACGRRGLDYRPYLRHTEEGGRSYRALAVCSACDAAFEF